MRFIPETANRQDWPRLVAQALNEVQRKVEAPAAAVTGSGSFTLDDGTASSSGVFVMDDGAA